MLRFPLSRSALTLALLLAAVPAGGSPSLPANFWFFNAVPGITFDTPTTIAFLPDGRMLVGEKRGVVWLVDKDGTRQSIPVWSGANEVLNEGDKGLLALAVDPDFDINHYVYFLYTVDPDSNGVDEPNSDAFGRLARFQINSSADTLATSAQSGGGVFSATIVEPASRALLFGRIWSEGPTIGSITHTIGSLRWGADKSLIVSCGDGGQFSVIDAGGFDPEMFEPGRANPSEDIGVFRSQDITSLCGKILRIDRETGAGYPSNPFWDGDPHSVRSRVWAYGLRNPFRVAVRPGGDPNPANGDPGSLYIGDVGWGTWEELSLSKSGGENFGWPCREGSQPNPQFLDATPAHNGCESIGTSTNPSPFTSPLGEWHHTDPGLSSIPGAQGNSVIGGAFYTGAGFPVTWQGRLFFGDYGFGWIRTATVDPDDHVTAWNDFAADMDGPVDFAVGPQDGDLYYVSILTGEVRRIHYYPPQPGNQTPQAVATFDQSIGPALLGVACSSALSSDPDGDSLRTTWDFGDGSGSFQANPVHVYANPGVYQIRLTVDDNHLGDHFVTQNIVVTGGANTRPVASVSAPLDSSFVAHGDTLLMIGSAIDTEQPEGTLSFDWDITLHHNNHVHPNTFVAWGPVAGYPVDQHDDGTGVWYEVRMRVTDTGGLADTVVTHVFPEVDLELMDFSTAPETLVTGANNTFRFTVRNSGHMPAPWSRWRMTFDDALFAEGDTLLGEQDSLSVTFDHPVTLAPGEYTMRLKLDTLATVVETDETNNALARRVVVTAMPVTGVRAAPAALGLSRGSPNPAAGTVHFALDLPSAARVEVRVLDVQGREVWAAPSRAFTAGRWPLAWDGRTARGAPAAAGIYLVQVKVGGTTMVRRVARTR